MIHLFNIKNCNGNCILMHVFKFCEAATLTIKKLKTVHGDSLFLTLGNSWFHME